MAKICSHCVQESDADQEVNRMPLFVPKFKPEVRDSTVQKAVAKECQVIRRGSAMGVRLAEVQ